MSLKNILLKLEKSGFLVFHQVIDMEFIDEIENIIPGTFSSDVYGIIYYTYDDYIMSLNSGYLRLNFIELEEPAFSMFHYVEEIFRNGNVNCEFINKHTIIVELNKDDMKFVEKNINFGKGNRLNNLVH